MGRRLTPHEAKKEAAKYLRLALALLEQSSEFVAAIRTAEALQIVNESDPDLRPGGAQVGGYFFDDAQTFSVTPATLADPEPIRPSFDDQPYE